MNLKDYIRSIPDYPKKGILFRDITTLIKDENAFAETINQIVERSKKYNFTKIAFLQTLASSLSLQGLFSQLVQLVDDVFFFGYLCCHSLTSALIYSAQLPM